MVDAEAVRAQVRDGAHLSSSYLLMNGAATFIAAYGLLADSTAVVIGAMLIAMLVGPIQGMALALAEGNLRLLAGAARSELAGTALILALGAAIGLLHPEQTATHGILARTSPNLFDLIVALVSGAAAAYATVSPRISAAVVGIAIATSLCPPLTVCGLMGAWGNYDLAFGAFLLFLTNLLAIAVSGMVVFMAKGFRPSFRAASSFTLKVLISRALFLAAFAVVGVYLAHTLQRMVADHALEANVNRTIREHVARVPGAYFVESRLRHGSGTREIVAVVRTPVVFAAGDVGRIDDALRKILSEPFRLHVRSVLTVDMTRDGIAAPQPAPRPRAP